MDGCLIVQSATAKGDECEYILVGGHTQVTMKIHRDDRPNWRAGDFVKYTFADPSTPKP